MTVRSVCVISREYPPDTAWGGIARIVGVQAQQLAREGVAVHVISHSPSGAARQTLEEGVVVHRIPPPGGVAPGMPYAELGLWSKAVAGEYARIDGLVGFDTVWVPDYFGESLHLVTRPETSVVAFLHTLTALATPSSRLDPVSELANQVEILALRRASVVVGLSHLVAERTEAVAGGLPAITVVPPPFDASMVQVARPERDPNGPLRLLFVGRLEANKRPEVALHALAVLRAQGVDAHLTLVGRDVSTDSIRSYRRDVLMPLVGELRLDHHDFRFVEQLDFEGVCRHLALADVALLPSRFENIHSAAIEALSAGVPVIAGSQSGLAGWLGSHDGLWVLDGDDPASLGRAAAAQALDVEWRGRAAVAGPVRVRELFDPSTVVQRCLKLSSEARDHLDSGPVAPVGGDGAPALSVVMLAHNALPYTKRAVASVLAHTRTPFELVVVDNASTDGTGAWLAGVDDPRLKVVALDENRGVSGGRNAGLAVVDDRAFYVAFLDNDVEVLAGWDVPFTDHLAAGPNVGIAGELGINLEFADDGRTEEVPPPGPRPCDMAVGFCMVMKAEAVRQIGGFDEGLGVFWHDDDDYAVRARRLGWGVFQVSSGLVLHFEHRSSETVDGIWRARNVPSDLSDQNQALLSERWRRFEAGAANGFIVVAMMDEVAEDPSVLLPYATTFTAEHPVLLAVHAPGWDEIRLERELRRAAREAGFDLETGPKVMAMTAATDLARQRELADMAYACLSNRAATGAFGHLPRFGATDGEQLRRLGLRVLAIQHTRRIYSTPPALSSSPSLA